MTLQPKPTPTMNRLTPLFAPLAFLMLAAQPAQAQQALQIGEAAPTLSVEQYLQAPEGEKSWQSLQGKAVILEFWATWCAPCIAQIPHLNELVNEFEDEPVRFISITDENEETVTPFLQDRPMSGWIGLDTDRSMFESYDVVGIPKTVLVYPNGELAAVTRAEKIDEQTIRSLIEREDLPQESSEQDGAAEKQSDAQDDEESALLEAVVKPIEGGKPIYSLGSRLLDAESIRLEDALRIAHDINRTRISGPASILNQWLRVKVTVPAGRDSLFRPTLRQVLSSALYINAHREKSLVDALVLTAPEDETGLRVSESGSYRYSSGEGTLAGSHATVDNLADLLESILERPVINETRLDGRYDWTVEFDEENPESVVPAIEEKLNLRLTPEEREVEVLVVEPEYGSAQNQD
jgi:uncharacterized protein (TIGR03435 family)